MLNRQNSKITQELFQCLGMQTPDAFVNLNVNRRVSHAKMATRSTHIALFLRERGNMICGHEKSLVILI
ncbi:hypothetical protein A138_20495 [Vibrio crassostreae 9ZC77]|nr:hypothetical protein A138_20495 [Vibrio crassostreae 9ZC77]